LDSTGGSTAEDARLARRSLLKKAAVAGAAAWTAPMVIESVTNPAGALTCAPGSYHVVYQTNLSQRSPTTGTGCTHSGTNTTAAAIGLAVSFTGSCTTADGGNSIAHIVSANGNCRPVLITVTGGCECTISSVFAHVHNRSAGTCPQTGGNYCWQAGTQRSGSPSGRIPLRIIAGGFGTTSITVQPNYTNVGATVCSGETGIHWGSPNAEDGYLVVNVTCTG